MKISKLAIIGGGNLGKSIAEGLIGTQQMTPSSLVVTRRNTQPLQHLSQEGVDITSNNIEAAENASMILLCVKPWQVQAVIDEISETISTKTLIVSCASGVSLGELESFCPKDSMVFRAMPNTAISVKESMTCISTNVTDKDSVLLVQSVFDALGTTLFINEELMDSATVLAACGIASCLRFMRAASQGGIEIGFSSDVAQTIAAQTAKGAASLILTNNTHPESEIDKVTTPKGCTIAGLNEMEHQGFSSALIKGIKTSFEKI